MGWRMLSLETCLVFFYEKVHQVWPWSTPRRGAEKQRFYACASLEPGNTRHAWQKHRVVRSRRGDGLSHSLYWSFQEKGKVGQGEQFGKDWSQ